MYRNVIKKFLACIIFLVIISPVFAQEINSTNFTSLGTTPISSGDFGLKFIANNDTNIVAVTKETGTSVSTTRIIGSDYSTLGTATFIGNTATFTTPITITDGNTYYVTINNGNSGFTTNYGDVESTLPATNQDITFPLEGNAVFKAPYSQTITGFIVGESSLGITGIITSLEVASTTEPEATTTELITEPIIATTTPTIIYTGDSLTEAIAVDYPYNYYLTLPSEYNQINLGVSGKYMSAINADKDTFLNPLMGSSTENIVVIWAGINDFWGGKTAQETYNALEEFCLHEQSLGYKVIVLTTISHLGGNPLYSDTTRNQYNTMIRNNWETFADGIADVALNENLGLDNSYLLTEYFADGAHLTNTGYELVANIVQPVLDEVITPAVVQQEVTYTLTQTQLERMSEILTELQSIISSATVE